MALLWLRLKIWWMRLWMCKHEKAWLDAMVFGKGFYYDQPKEWFGISLVEEINKVIKEQHENSNPD